MDKLKFNKGNFPVKATPQEYEKWGKGFFKELRAMFGKLDKVCDHCQAWQSKCCEKIGEGCNAYNKLKEIIK